MCPVIKKGVLITRGRVGGLGAWLIVIVCKELRPEVNCVEVAATLKGEKRERLELS